MPRFLYILDLLIDAGILAVLVFTPVAFGATEPWARSAGQILVVLVAAAWLLKVIWSPSHVAERDRPGRIFGNRVRLCGLELPALAFVALVALQLVPLPAGLIRAVSPETAAVFTTSLPGWGQPSGSSFAGMQDWLYAEMPDEAGGVAVLPPSDASVPAMPATWFDAPRPSSRALSLIPAHTRRALGVFLGHLAFLVVVFNQFGRRPAAKRTFVVLAGLAGLLSVVGILQSLTADGRLYWWRSGGPRASFGPFANANNFAGWMELALPLAAGLTWLYWRRAGRRSTRSPARIAFFGFVTLAGVVALVLAQSRGGLLALFGALLLALLVTLFAGRLRAGIAAVALALVLAGMATAAWIDGPALRERYGTLVDIGDEHSFRSRLAFSKTALKMAADFPVLGTGFGTFREAYYLYTPGRSQFELARTHNDYAQLLSECGFAGGLVLLWGLFVLVRRGVAPGLAGEPGPDTWLPRAAAVGVTAILLHSLVDFNLQIYSNSMLFVFLCAVLLWHGREQRSGKEKKP